jgi:hypothetical protein
MDGDNISDIETTEESSTDEEVEGGGLPLTPDRSLEILSLVNYFDIDNEGPPFTFHRRLAEFRLPFLMEQNRLLTCVVRLYQM